MRNWIDDDRLRESGTATDGPEVMHDGKPRVLTSIKSDFEVARDEEAAPVPQSNRITPS